MRQKATVLSAEGAIIRLSISCGDACAGCAAKSVCGSGSSKTIEIENDGQGWTEGDRVIIEISSTSGLRAVLLAYVLPTMLIVAGIIVMQSLGISEIWAAMAAVALTLIYFVLIKVFGLGQRSTSIKISKDNE